MSTIAHITQPPEAIIHDGNWWQFINPELPDGTTGRHGLEPRNYATHPLGFYSWATAADFPLIPQAEWAARCQQKTQEKSWLSDIRNAAGPGSNPIPSRDQNGKGYCWAHSGVSAHLLIRAVMGEPYADLSAYSIACPIKNFRDEGGWGAQGLDYQVANGCATSATWPQQSMSRSNVNDAEKADAAAHKVIDQWADLNSGQYDRNLSFNQVATLLLADVPVVSDFNWWSHSVCAADLVNGAQQFGQTRMESGKLASLSEHAALWAMNDPVTAGFGIRIWNSWGNSWSSNGMGVLTGSKAVPDGSVAPRIVRPSP